MANQIIAEGKSRKPARRKVDNENLINLHRLILQARDLSVELTFAQGVELESIIHGISAILLPTMPDSVLDEAWALHRHDPKPAARMVNQRGIRYRHRLRRDGDLVPALPE
ncbi:MAG TPA: hypothetical protein PKC18_12460 [Lacipirellulaceae bacterium]|nr:hypothetical protein [Lacipirellulaceae bacterium]